MNQLALYGGAKAKSVPYSTGRRFGAEELQQVAEALEQDSLFYWKGKKVRQFCEKFSKLYGTKHRPAQQRFILPWAQSASRKVMK